MIVLRAAKAPSVSQFASVPSGTAGASTADRRLQLAHLGRAATRALYDELALYPKPGLVSFVDNGSHADMTAHTFIRSILSLREYFSQIADLGATASPFRELQELGIAAERRMCRATGNVNTHRGAIFMLGMLCAAAGRCVASCGQGATAHSVRAALGQTWGDALAAHACQPERSNGQRAAREHGLRGARNEAAAGFPILFDCALPALGAASVACLPRRQALLQTFFVVMATLEDTNLVHRGGMGGLRFAQREASSFLAAGGANRPDAIEHAEAIHRAFVGRRLSPGGTADVLAAASLVARLCE